MNKKIFWSNSTYDEANIIIFGMPYDKSVSYKKGTVDGPDAIREEAEWAVETYSPILDLALEDKNIFDDGNFEIQNLEPVQMVEEVNKKVSGYLNDGKQIFGIGGDHSVTIGEIEAAYNFNHDLHIIHFDAHTDLREEFTGSKLSHASVMKRAYDLVGPNKIFQFGIRSGSKEEYDAYYKTDLVYAEHASATTIAKIVSELKDKPVFISIDIDVLDPSIIVGTGTPEPGGLTYKELEEAIHALKELNNVVGADLVELSPKWDNSKSSTVLAIKILRELILTVAK